MNRLLAILFTFLILGCGTSCAGDEPDKAPANTGEEYFSGKKVLVAYFSWGGTTKHMAEQIRDITGADIFRIEPVTPYPMAYTPCTEVALEEKNSNTRPAIKDRVANWDDYDVVFIGCPVWWWTTPMIIHTFAESYDFTGKTVVPFCTYAATYHLPDTATRRLPRSSTSLRPRATSPAKASPAAASRPAASSRGST